MDIKRLSIVFSLLGVSAAIAANAPGLFYWEDMIDRGRDDYAQSVAISGETAVVATVIGAPGGKFNFTVRASELRTQRLLWEDAVPNADTQAGPGWVTALGGNVYALGIVNGRQANSSDFFVRGYEAVSGKVLWTYYLDAGQDDVPTAIVAANGLVFVTGSGGNAPNETPHGLVRALNAFTGKFLWQATVNKKSSNETVWRVASDGLYVVVAGTSTNASGTRDLFLQARYAQSGALQWEDIIPGVTPGAVKIVGSTIILAGGMQLSTGAFRTYLTGFSIFTGNRVWAQPDIAGLFSDMVADNYHVVVTGTVGTNRGLFVQCSSSVTGTVLWTSTTSPAPGYGDGINKLALTKTAVYGVGHSWRDMAYSENIVRIYGIDGALLVDEHTRPTLSVLNDVAVSGVFMTTAGYTRATMVSPADAIVRSYVVSAFEPTFAVSAPAQWAAPLAFQKLMDGKGVTQ